MVPNDAVKTFSAFDAAAITKEAANAQVIVIFSKDADLTDFPNVHIFAGPGMQPVLTDLVQFNAQIPANLPTPVQLKPTDTELLLTKHIDGKAQVCFTKPSWVWI